MHTCNNIGKASKKIIGVMRSQLFLLLGLLLSWPSSYLEHNPL